MQKTTTASTYNARNFPASMGTAIKELTKVSGIGITRAKQLYKQGITSIDLLRQNQNTTKLNKLQQLGIKYTIYLIVLIKRLLEVDLVKIFG